MGFDFLPKALKTSRLCAIASGAILTIGALTALEIDNRVEAIVVPGNPNDYIVSPGTGYDGVVRLDISTTKTPFSCSGSLLRTGKHILSSAQCLSDDVAANSIVNNVKAFFDLPGGTVSIDATKLFIHPDWSGLVDIEFLQGDIAILELASVAPEAAERYDIYRNTDEVGQVGIKVGYGLSGQGNVGFTEDFPLAKRLGQNKYDAPGEIWNNTVPGVGKVGTSLVAPGAVLAYDFDNGLPEIESFWSYIVLTSDSNFATNNFLLAVSNSSDPTAGWTGFKINMPATVSNSPPKTFQWGNYIFIEEPPETATLATYPTLGLDADGVYLSSNNVNYFDDGKSVSVASIPKADLLSPTPTVANAKILGDLDNSQYGFSIQPALDFGASDNRAALLGINHRLPNLLVEQIGETSNSIKRSDILNSGSSLANISPGVDIQVDNYSLPISATQPLPSNHIRYSVPTIEVMEEPIYRGPRLVLPDDSSTPFVSSLPTIELPDNSPTFFSEIADFDTRFTSNVFEVGNSLWATHNIAVSSGVGLPRVGIRWYEIDERTNAVLQSGTISDRDYDYFLPSIAANQFGDVVIGFNRSGGISIDGTGKNEFVSSYAVLGQTTNGVTTFGNPLLLKAGLDRYSPTIRPPFGIQPWGSYSATVVDPSDPFSFWTFQAFADKSNSNLGSRWSTQITQVKVTRSVPEPGSALGLLAFGVLGVGSVLKRNPNNNLL